MVGSAAKETIGKKHPTGSMGHFPSPTSVKTPPYSKRFIPMWTTPLVIKDHLDFLVPYQNMKKKLENQSK